MASFLRHNCWCKQLAVTSALAMRFQVTTVLFGWMNICQRSLPKIKKPISHHEPDNCSVKICRWSNSTTSSCLKFSSNTTFHSISRIWMTNSRNLPICTKILRQLNAIDYAITDAKRGAENKCRKFKKGQVQWCPQITAAINKILFWKCILKQELSSKVGLTVLHTRAGKASITSVPYPGEYQVENLQAFISKVYKQFQCLECDETRHELPN